MKKILVTGGNGQLGSELKAASGNFPNMDFIFTDVEELDITDAGLVERFIADNAFDALINCAAYNAVDQAEKEPGKAMLINAEAVKNLVVAAVKFDCYPIHISTDYVFSGHLKRPYTENDVPDPVSAYGRTKLEGEKLFYEWGYKGLIIRTSWLYSSYGKNYVKAILQSGRTNKELKVVSDQVGSPTYARDLALVILQILPGVIEDNKHLIYHYSNEGECSRYDLAVETLRSSGINCRIIPVPTSEYPATATRPLYSVLDTSNITKEFGITIPNWKDSLHKCLKLLND